LVEAMLVTHEYEMAVEEHVDVIKLYLWGRL
jgi:hypothetical protein